MSVTTVPALPSSLLAVTPEHPNCPSCARAALAAATMARATGSVGGGHGDGVHGAVVTRVHYVVSLPDHPAAGARVYVGGVTPAVVTEPDTDGAIVRELDDDSEGWHAWADLPTVDAADWQVHTCGTTTSTAACHACQVLDYRDEDPRWRG